MRAGAEPSAPPLELRPPSSRIPPWGRALGALAFWLALCAAQLAQPLGFVTLASLVFMGALLALGLCALTLLIRLGAGGASQAGVVAGMVARWSALGCGLAVTSVLVSSRVCELHIRAGQARLVAGLEAARERTERYPERLPQGLETVRIGWATSAVAYRSEGSRYELWFETPLMLRAAYDSSSGRWETLD